MQSMPATSRPTSRGTRTTTCTKTEGARLWHASRTGRRKFGVKLDIGRIRSLKLGVHSFDGNYDGIPEDITRLDCFKVAGAYIAKNSAAPGLKLLAKVSKRLSNLDNIAKIVDSEKVSNTVQMKIELIAVCAVATPGYWTRIMLPEHTRLATRFSDDAVTKATLLALHAAGTPEARRELAAEQSRLRPNTVLYGLKLLVWRLH